MLKKAILSAAVALSAMFASSAMAGNQIGTVVLTQGSYSSGSGGEFQANLTYTTPPNFNVVLENSKVGSGPVTATGAVFQTFCIEQGINGVAFSPGTTYNAFDSGTSVPLPAGGTLALSHTTAALYNAFYTGALSGYDFTNSGSLGRKASAGALQAAIWYSMGDDATLSAAFGSAGISSDAAAQTQAQTWYNYYSNVANQGGYANVQILELASANGTLAQAQLVEATPTTPLPATAGTTALFLTCVGMFAGIRKRFGKTSAAI